MEYNKVNYCIIHSIKYKLYFSFNSSSDFPIVIAFYFMGLTLKFQGHKSGHISSRKLVI